jgi:hypothetical protein
MTTRSWLVLLAILGFTSTLGAQSKTSVIVAGVADAETHAPLSDAQVRLPDLGRLVRTDWMGEARIAGVAFGPTRIEVRKLGYAPADITLPISGDSIGPVFMLARAVSVLDTVTVMGRVVPTRLKDFEIRRRTGLGRFVTDSVLEKEASRPLSLLISTRFPGIRVSSASPSGLSSMRFSTAISRGANYCNIDVYLDDMPFREHIDAIRPWEVAGVEFYTMETAPPQYRRGTGSCQVILLWSKW